VKSDVNGFRIVGVLMLAVVIGMIGVLSIVSKGIDDHQRRRDEAMVGLRLARVAETAGEDLAPLTVWDDAVRELGAPTGPQWFDRFVGGALTVRHGHIATLSYDTSGQLLRANHAGGQPHASEAHPMARAARPLIDQLAAEAQGRDRSTHGRAAAVVKSGFVKVDGAVYVVAVSTVVRHTATGPAADGDPMIATFKPFDAEVEWIRTRMGKADVRFMPGTQPPDGLTGIPILDADGSPLGQVVWTPDRPGYSILTHALPLLLLLMGLLGVCGGLLMWRMMTDMRRMRASEAALSVALERAEAANAAKSRFLSNISHELRTPLNGVLGMAEVLGHDALTPRQRERLDILKESGHRQLRLIEDLLDVVRLGDGAVTLDERPFRPGVLLRGLYNDHRAAAAAKGLSLKIEAVEGDWLGDAVHLEKLLGALLHNAIRFTASGEVIVRVLDCNGLTFEVQDTGAGMTKAEAAVLFDPFAQRDDSRTRTAEGLGLGLTAANGLARLMGGRIEVDSTPGAGSLFRVILPLTPALRSSEPAAA
jgi:signal transduction histidine kinase